KRSEIEELNRLIDKKKNELANAKKNLEKLESEVQNQLSAIRGQRQHLKHRFDLKLKAIENLKKTGAELDENISPLKLPKKETKSPIYDKDVDMNEIYESIMEEANIEEQLLAEREFFKDSTIQKNEDKVVEMKSKSKEQIKPLEKSQSLIPQNFKLKKNAN